MRDPNRIEPMLEELGRLWKQTPDLRLGQLVVSMALKRDIDAFYIEDDKMFASICDGLGWVDWESKLNASPYRSLRCPVDEAATVEVELQGGGKLTSRAGELYWYLEATLPVSIKRYRVVHG